MDRGTDSIPEMRKIVSQLQLESKLDRIPVSQAAKAIIAYCEANGNDDPLLNGIPASMNPFKEKKSCTIV